MNAAPPSPIFNPRRFPLEDGTCHVEGEKAWISAGDHTLPEINVRILLAG